MDALLQRLERSLTKMGNVDNESLNDNLVKAKVIICFNIFILNHMSGHGDDRVQMNRHKSYA